MANELASILTVGTHIEVTFRGLTSNKQFEKWSGVVLQFDGANIAMTLKGDKPQTLVFSISSARYIRIS